jgi:hypothetical protein
MSMPTLTAKEELLAAYDDALSYQWESLDAALRDVSENEAWYQDPAYLGEPAGDGYPPAGTILWHVVHLAHCYRSYRLNVIERPNKVVDPPTPVASSLAEAIANLRQYRSELRETIAALRDEQLAEPLQNYESISEQMRMMIRHDAWHGGQISMIKRLHRFTQP